MRNAKVLAAASLLALVVTLPPAHAAAPPASPDDGASLVASPKWGAADHHRYAVRCLVHGRTFARAAQHAREATRRRPEKYEHHLVLACALASRYASIGFAFSLNEQVEGARRQYPERHRKWEESRRRTLEAGGTFGDPEPEEPGRDLAFSAKDDSKPLGPRAAVRAEMARLRTEAAPAFDAALARARTPAERAEVENARGYALILLGMYGIAEEVAAGPHVDPYAEPPAEAMSRFRQGLIGGLRALERAVEEEPGNAVWHESLGFAREMLRHNADELRGAPVPGPDAPKAPRFPSVESAWEAYDASLRLNARNAPLWLKRAQREKEKQAGRDAVHACLAAAAKADPANALYRYESAAFEFESLPFAEYRIALNLARMREQGREVRQTPERERKECEAVERATAPQTLAAAAKALRSLEWGNAAPRVSLGRHAAPVPKMLEHAWSYAGALFLQNAAPATSETNLATAVTGYAQALAASGNVPGALRAVDSLRTMGEKMMGAWPVRDERPGSGEVDLALSGRYAVVSSFAARAAVLRRAGDAEGAARVEADRAAFEARVREWEAARKAAGGSEWERIYGGHSAS